METRHNQFESQSLFRDERHHILKTALLSPHKGKPIWEYMNFQFHLIC